VVFEFLKKKFHSLTTDAVAAAEPRPGADEDYEERRARAEALHEKGETAEAVALLEGLAADLAGDGSFPLAVAVRHQISSWRAGPPATQTAARDAEEMARKREETGVVRARSASPPGAPIPEGLERSRFFAEMTKEEIAGFIASTVRRTFREGEVVLEQGKSGRDFYIVTRGILRVEAAVAEGRKLRMGVLVPGDVFGEVAFLTGRPRTATVLAETAAECLEIGGDAWDGVLAGLPRVRKVLEEVHQERARFAADAIVEELRRKREAGRKG
jgi:hypothetical protein